MPRIIAYQHDADTYCVRCTVAAYPDTVPDADPNDVDRNGIPHDARGADGDPVSPVFSFDEWCNGGYDGCYLECGTCARVIAQHGPSEHGFCDCGDGCAQWDCPSCDDRHYEPAEDDERVTGCPCDACVAGAEWVATHPTALEPLVLEPAGPTLEWSAEAMTAYIASFEEVA